VSDKLRQLHRHHSIENCTCVVWSVSTVAQLVAVEVARNLSKISRNDRKSSKRGKRRVFASTAVYQAILRDYMGIPGNLTTPIFGSEFKLMFRLSKPRCQRLMEDIMAEDLFFYKRRKSSSITTVLFRGKAVSSTH
jgi:hypothetical protein